jgi:hypothetical protein
LLLTRTNHFKPARLDLEVAGDKRTEPGLSHHLSDLPRSRLIFSRIRIFVAGGRYAADYPLMVPPEFVPGADADGDADGP